MDKFKVTFKDGRVEEVDEKDVGSVFAVEDDVEKVERVSGRTRGKPWYKKSIFEIVAGRAKRQWEDA